MLETLLRALGYATNAFTFVTTNLKVILITAATVTILYFVVGFFNLRSELARTQEELQRSKAQVEQLQKDIQDITAARDDLSKKTRELEETKRELTEKLMKHDLSKMSQRHSKLVEKAINEGTDKTLKCFEAVSRGGDC
jgi:cell division protein FtsL